MGKLRYLGKNLEASGPKPLEKRNLRLYSGNQTRRGFDNPESEFAEPERGIIQAPSPQQMAVRVNSDAELTAFLKRLTEFVSVLIRQVSPPDLVRAPAVNVPQKDRR